MSLAHRGRAAAPLVTKRVWPQLGSKRQKTKAQPAGYNTAGRALDGAANLIFRQHVNRLLLGVGLLRRCDQQPRARSARGGKGVQRPAVRMAGYKHGQHFRTPKRPSPARPRPCRGCVHHWQVTRPHHVHITSNAQQRPTKTLCASDEFLVDRPTHCATREHGGR